MEIFNCLSITTVTQPVMLLVGTCLMLLSVGVCIVEVNNNSLQETVSSPNGQEVFGIWFMLEQKEHHNKSVLMVLDTETVL